MSSAPIRIGVIAEDTSDVEVLYELTAKLIEPNKFSFRRFVGKGCGKIKRKCGAWASALQTKGFTQSTHKFYNEGILLILTFHTSTP